MPSFRPGQSASQAHRALKTSVKIMDQARHCAVLWFGEIMRRELYRELGFSSMRAYALDELGFSPTRAGDFIRLARKLEELPAVKKEMAAGKLGYTKAREIATVADSHNEKAWLQEAQQKSRGQLVATIKHAKAVARQRRQTHSGQGELMPRPAPAVEAAETIRVGFEFTPHQYARYEALLAKIEHRHDKAELLLDALAALLAADENTPRGASESHYQIHVHECPACARATVQTPRGEKELTPTEAETVRCDATVQQPGRRNTTTIPPKTRREVFARDRHRCRRKGCTHTRHLHLHHIVPRHEGGTNDQENLNTLCAGCHRLWHERGGDLLSRLTAAA